MSRAIDLVWLSWVILWIILARRVKGIDRQQSPLSRWGHILALTLAAFFTFSDWPDLGQLQGAWLPNTPLTAAIGFFISLVGMAFTSRARCYLGSNWSGRVTVKTDHELVDSGPYQLVRHPIYSGLLLALLGSSMVYGRKRCIVGVFIFFIAFSIKARLEERTLTAHFGEAYVDYIRRTKRLIPYLW